MCIGAQWLMAYAPQSFLQRPIVHSTQLGYTYVLIPWKLVAFFAEKSDLFLGS